MVLARELVTVLHLIAEQEIIQGVLCHVRVMPQKFLLAVMVRTHDIERNQVLIRYRKS